MTRVAGFLFVLFLLVSAAAAQKQPTHGKVSAVAANKLTALKVTGTARYTDKEILAASGLQIGQNAADGDFREAAQRLGDSGLFSDVVYSYSSSGAGVRLEMQLADTDQSKLVPAHFENFVWFTDDELRTASAKPRPAVQAVAADCRQSSRPGFRGAASHPHRETISRTGKLSARKPGRIGWPPERDRLPGRGSQHPDSQRRIPRSFARADGSARNRSPPPHRSRIRARYSGRGRKV